MTRFLMAAFLAAAQAAAPSASPPADPPSDSAADLATLQQLYDESCGSRGYGAYDDLCIPLTEQLRQAKRVAAQHPQAQPPKIAAPVPPAAHTSLPPDKPMESGATQSAPNAPTPS